MLANKCSIIISKLIFIQNEVVLSKHFIYFICFYLDPILGAHFQNIRILRKLRLNVSKRLILTIFSMIIGKVTFWREL